MTVLFLSPSKGKIGQRVCRIPKENLQRTWDKKPRNESNGKRTFILEWNAETNESGGRENAALCN